MRQRHGREVERVWSDTPLPEVAEPEPGPPADGGGGSVRVRLSTSGRRGKTVTVISGLPAAERPAIAKQLRRACGSGGSVKGDAVEIQGDHRDAVTAQLSDRFRVRSG